MKQMGDFQFCVPINKVILDRALHLIRDFRLVNFEGQSLNLLSAD